jgi:hypothetical protein
MYNKCSDVYGDAEDAAPAFLRAWREANGLLANMCFQNFDYSLAQVFNLLYDPETGLTLDRLLPAVFGRAIDSFERSARVLAVLCERLCSLLPETQQHDFKTILLRLADCMMRHVSDGSETDEQLVNIARKQRGTAVFLGELFLQRLVPPACLRDILEFCTQRSLEPTDAGIFFTELACLILNVCGHSATSVPHLDQIVKTLNAALTYRYKPMMAPPMMMRA